MSCGSLASRPAVGDRADRARLLGEEDVGGGVVALLDQGRGEVGGVAVADLDVAVGLGLVHVDRAADRRRDPARVEGDPLGGRLGRPAPGVLGGGAAGAER